MDEPKLCESDFRFMTVIWDNEPLPSGRLVELCAAELGWKKSTTYTALKKLCGRGFARNENALVTALIPREMVLSYESERFVKRTFQGSLPRFLVSFLGERKLTEAEAAELKTLIDAHRKEENT